MITHLTALGIACAFAQATPQQQQTVLSQLSTQEMQSVLQVDQQTECVPENLNKILQQGRLDFQNGIVLVRYSANPCGGCD